MTSAPPAVLRVNTAPVLALIPDKVINRGALLTFTASATDADIPRQTLTYSLDTGAPPGAGINPASGVFTWTPSATADASTNRVTLRVTDNGLPPLSAAQTVTITVVAGFTTNVTLVTTGSVWKYRDTGEDLGSAWTGLTFDDSAWASGRAKLGYGSGDETTVVSYGPDSSAKYITTYFRSHFTVSDPGTLSALSLRVLRDDGVVVYLNGREVYRDNMPAGPISYLTPAAASASDGGTVYQVSPPVDPGYLVAGDNVVAAEIHQRSGSSSDIAFELELTGNQSIVAPVVMTQPQSQSVGTGGSVAFRVDALGALPLHYQWHFNDFPVPDATNATLTLSHLQLVQAGGYFVVVTNFYGATASAVATLLITNTPPVLAAIGNKLVTEGSLLTFTATASGSGLAAQRLTFSLDPGAPSGASILPTTGVFTWTPTEAQGPSTNTVTVRVNDLSTGLSDFETITITVRETNTAPVLATIWNKIVRVDSLLTFTASATDADIPRQTLTCSLDAGAPAGASINPSNGVFTWTPTEAQGPGTNRVTVRVTDNGSPPLSAAQTVTITVLAGSATNVTLVATGSVWRYRDTGEDLGSAWTGLDFDDSGWASGRAKLGYGNGDEATVVSYGPDPSAKYITTYFRSHFMVTDPSALSALSLRVLRDDGVVVYLNGREVYRDNMPAGPIDYLTAAAASASDDGTLYQVSPPVDPSYLVAGDNVVAVEIHQRSGTSSDIAFDLELTGTQNILEPVVTAQPQSQSVMQGGSAAFSVAAIGAQPLSYQWYLNDIPIPGATNAALTLTDVQPAQAGTYSVVVGSAAGTTTTSGAVLTVTPFVSLAEALDTPAWVWTTSGSPPWMGQSVVTHDGVDTARSGAVGDGNSGTIQTTVTGPGTVSFWWKVSSETNNDILRFYLAGSEVARISGEVDWQWRSFRVSSGSQALQWKYSKNGSSSGGQDQGWVDEVLFIPDGVLMAPIIASQPASQSVVAPATVTFNVGAAGSEQLSYQWQFNGMNLTDGGNVSDATTATLTLTSVQANQAGTYSVLVWNAAGSATSSNATLAIITAPLITSQPVNQTVAAGATVTFNAAAIGSGTLNYQWRFNGTNLLDGGNVSGARTASLTLANVQLTQAGNYSVVASNAQGVAASSNALLGVTPVLTLGAALDAPSLMWSTASSAPWLPQTNVTHDRVDAARSSGIANNQTTWLETAVEGPATLSFWWKVSSRPNHDVLLFVVNGMERARISGEVDWQRQTFDLPAGHLVLRWAYSKDSTATTGQDRAWLDEVESAPTFGPTTP